MRSPAGNANTGTLTLGAGNLLNVTSADLYIHGGTVTNDGAITIGTNSRLFSGGGAVNFGGTGTIVLDNTSGSAQLSGSGQRFDFGAGQTVRGRGQIGINNTFITNAGLFSADVASGGISINSAGGSAGVAPGTGVGTGGVAGLFNSGIMQATNGGTLSFESGYYENAPGGIIRAINSSTVVLGNDSRIVGGTLTSDATSTIVDGGGNIYLTNATLSSGSRLNLTSVDLYAGATLTNEGTINVGVNSRIFREASAASLTFLGTGAIVLDNSSGYSQISGNSGDLIFGANQAIQGSGEVGINASDITNNGIFSSSGTITVDSAGGSGGRGGAGVGTGGNAGLINNNIMEASGASTLTFASGYYENAPSGIIRSVGGSTLIIGNDARIVNGTLTSDATSTIIDGGGNFYLTDVTLSSGTRLNITSADLYAGATLTNEGTINVGVNSRIFREASAASLTFLGTGAIVLDNSVGYSQISGNGGDLIFGANQTILGSGQVGINTSDITNNGIFSASGGGSISVDSAGGSGGRSGAGVGTSGNAGLINNNIMQATGASTLSFESGYYENAAGGIMRSAGGSTLVLGNDSRIVNGTLTSDASSTIIDGGGNFYLTDVTLSSGTRLNITSADLYAGATLTNEGTINVGVNSRIFREASAASLTFLGTGAIVLDNSVGYSQISGNGGDLIFGANQTILGSGQVGINTSDITNNGIFSASGGGSISVDSAGGSGGRSGAGVGTGGNAGLINTNVIEAAGGSTLSFESGYYENAAGGIMRAVGGSTLVLGNDSRIVNGTLTSDATSTIIDGGGNIYLTNATLSGGTRLNLTSVDLYANTALTTNGTINVGVNSRLFNESGATTPLALNGSGTIVLDNSGGYSQISGNGGALVIGAGLLINGSGQLGINNSLITNNGTISASTGTGLSIDARGGSGGTAGGLGTGGISGLLNNGTIEATNGKTLSFESGRYENGGAGLGGQLFANAGGSIVFNNDANFVNLKTGGVLDAGKLRVEGFGGTSTINLRSTGANSLVTIGTAAGSVTEVQLQGAQSVLNVTNFSTGVNTSIDQTLTGVAASGVFALDGRNFTVAAGGGNFSNAGLHFVRDSAFTANSYTNSGTLIGDGTSSIVSPIANTGTVRAASGTMATQAITGAGGTITIDPGATLNLGGASTAGNLTNNGTLGLGASNITVTSNYTNASFGSGNAFNNHANVTGAGLILAASATMDLSGPALTGNTLNLGNIRNAGATSTGLTITNNGASTNLIGAVQNTSAPGVTLTGANWTAAAGGGTANVTINFAGTSAGSLAGQTLNVVNNFDNVADATLNLTGAVYQVANPVINNVAAFNVGPVLVGSLVTRALDISNSQVAGALGFQEGLNVSWGAVTGNSVAGATGSLTNLAAGLGNNSTMVLTFDTSTVGNKTGAIDVLLATNGAGTSGLGVLGLPTQNLAVTGVVNGLVVNPAAATILNANPVVVAAQRVGGANTASISVRNDGIGPSAGLDGSFASATGAVTGSGSFTNIGSGSTSNAISVGVNTATSGVKTGTATLDFASNLSPNPNVALPSQTVNVTGNVYQQAVALLASNTVNFGVVRQNDPGPTGSLGITNSASGALTDSLVTSVGSLPAGVSGSAPGPLAAGQSANANFALNTATAGVVNASGSLNFASHNTEMSDLALAPQNVNFVGTITQLASASLFQNSGTGIFSGSGNAYTLNLGSLGTNSGIFSGNLGVTNAIPLSAFSEFLGGSFGATSGAGFSFAGNSFSGLAGGQSNLGNLFSFDTTGLADGNYFQTITFSGFSSFPGLSNFNFAPITVNVSANITGGVGGAVPEPASWLMMILGFGLIGGVMRRKQVTQSRLSGA